MTESEYILKYDKMILKHAYVLSKCLSRIYLLEDAKQELIMKLLERYRNAYDDKRGGEHSLTVFTSLTLRGIVTNQLRTKKLRFENSGIDIAFADDCHDSNHFEDSQIFKITCEHIESHLINDGNERAAKIFNLLTLGFNRLECSEKINVSKTLISTEINSKIHNECRKSGLYSIKK